MSNGGETGLMVDYLEMKMEYGCGGFFGVQGDTHNFFLFGDTPLPFTSLPFYLPCQC